MHRIDLTHSRNVQVSCLHLVHSHSMVYAMCVSVCWRWDSHNSRNAKLVLMSCLHVFRFSIFSLFYSSFYEMIFEKKWRNDCTRWKCRLLWYVSNQIKIQNEEEDDEGIGTNDRKQRFRNFMDARVCLCVRRTVGECSMLNFYGKSWLIILLSFLCPSPSSSCTIQKTVAICLRATRVCMVRVLLSLADSVPDEAITVFPFLDYSITETLAIQFAVEIMVIMIYTYGNPKKLDFVRWNCWWRWWCTVLRWKQL